MSGYLPFAVARDEGPEGVVVRVSGEVDVSCAEELQAVLRSDGGRPFVVDLSDTTFMDSSALNALVQAAREGAVFTVRNSTPSVQKLFELTGLASYLAPSA